MTKINKVFQTLNVKVYLIDLALLGSLVKKLNIGPSGVIRLAIRQLAWAEHITAQDLKGGQE